MENAIRFFETRKWKAAYVDEEVLDGAHWELAVETASIRIASTGSNAYPPGFQKLMRLPNKITIETGIQMY